MTILLYGPFPPETPSHFEEQSGEDAGMLPVSMFV